jgi:small subunit ribosomal protein S7
LDAVRKKKGKSTDKKLAEELMDAFNQTGTVIKKKDDTQRMAEANRAFAHLR